VFSFKWEIETIGSKSKLQSLCLGVEPTLGLVTRCYFLSESCCLKVAVSFQWGAFSDGRTGLQFAVQSLNDPIRAEFMTILYCLIYHYPNLEGQVHLFVSLQEHGGSDMPPGTESPL
jgi:hypothetical protein